MIHVDHSSDQEGKLSKIRDDIRNALHKAREGRKGSLYSRSSAHSSMGLGFFVPASRQDAPSLKSSMKERGSN